MIIFQKFTKFHMLVKNLLINLAQSRVLFNFLFPKRDFSESLQISYFLPFTRNLNIFEIKLVTLNDHLSYDLKCRNLSKVFGKGKIIKKQWKIRCLDDLFLDAGLIGGGIQLFWLKKSMGSNSTSVYDYALWQSLKRGIGGRCLALAEQTLLIYLF